MCVIYRIMGLSKGCSREFKESGSRVKDPTNEVFKVSSNVDLLGSNSVMPM